MAYSGGRWALVCGLSLAVVLFSMEARAEDTREEVLSLTFSPLHLLFPAIEVQGEYKVIDGLGVSLIGAYGWPTDEAEDVNGETVDIRFDVLEVGTQVMWYPLHKFRSLQLGIEAMYVHVSTTEPVGSYDATAFGGGFAVGPLVGYKFIVGPGFTGFVQLGFSYVSLQAEANDTTGATETAEENGVILNLNLNLGWSF